MASPWLASACACVLSASFCRSASSDCRRSSWLRSLAASSASAATFTAIIAADLAACFGASCAISCAISAVLPNCCPISCPSWPLYSAFLASTSNASTLRCSSDSFLPLTTSWASKLLMRLFRKAKSSLRCFACVSSSSAWPLRVCSWLSSLACAFSAPSASFLAASSSAFFFESTVLSKSLRSCLGIELTEPAFFWPYCDTSAAIVLDGMYSRKL
mmetsp:Transcript_12568/g.32917  ORF Transcript_12568/g.32917 Transcript_12568/m.32917 type:complete len:216 (-) Transcript_12568:983-1630(-)